MKIRSGFVSNSSSASFVVPKGNLNKLQKDIILNIQDILYKTIIGYEYVDFSGNVHGFNDEWTMTEDDECFIFNTYMDNHNLAHILIGIGITVERICDE